MEKQKSITANFIFNLFRTFMSLIFPIITFSYASRILLTDGIGKINFATSMVTYFTLIASLGISNYGIREGARIRDHKDKFSKFTQELLLINFITTFIAYILFFLIIYFVPELEKYRDVLLISGVSIGMTALGLEWMYTALEDYKYIAIRQVVFQVISLLFLFAFVKKKDDYMFYAFILVFSSVGANVFNFIHARKFIYFKRYKQYRLKKHIKPVMILFSYTLSINLYNNLDSIMLGFMVGDISVGLYSAAVKINRMVITLISSLGSVLVPRLSYYLEQGDKQRFHELIKKSLHFSMLFSIPAAAGLWALSKEIIVLFSGIGFVKATITMRALVPIVLIIPITTLVNCQILIPSKKEQYVVITTFVGAFVNLCMNSILIPKYEETGAAAASVMAEFCVMFTALILLRKMYSIRELFQGVWKYFVAAVPIFLISKIVHMMITNTIFIIITTICLSVLTYFLALIMMKNKYILEIKNKYFV